jgi:transcriptional regulator with XRE-family HTH domain
MGLFFDQDWFDARLTARGLKRSALAQATGMSIDEVDMVFRDQRELDGQEVYAIARVLAVEPREVASRSGSAEPTEPPRAASPMAGDAFDDMIPARSAPGEFKVTRDVINGLHERMDRLERMLELVLTKIDKLQR